MDFSKQVIETKGSPFSFSFYMVLEALSRGLKSLILMGTVQPYVLGCGCMPVSHVAFTDDVVIFSRGDRRSVS